jgi:hypothetical protein
MPKAGLAPAITVFERSKTVYAPDRSATATGLRYIEQSFLACFPYFEKLNVDLCNSHAVCVSMCL